jgi:hypothetical protein
MRIVHVGAPLPAVEPHLVRQIEVEVRRHDLKRAGILSSAVLHGDQWRPLGWGPRPYRCSIGDRTLWINADRTYFDVQGRKLGQFGKAPDNLLFQRARYFREGNLPLDLESPIGGKEHECTSAPRGGARQVGMASAL